MKLTDIAPKTDVRLITKVMKSYFAPKVDVSNLSETKARTMLTKTRALIKEAKNTPALHTSEKSPAYLELLMLEQALRARIAEAGADSPSYANGTAYQSAVKNAIAPDIKDTDEDEEEDEDMEEGHCSSSRKKMKESKLTESEVETAQVVLAAQDMVDKIAGWMEDVADMQYKDLPSLVEMMRNEVGVNEAQTFLDAQTATLSSLLTALEQAKADATNAMAPLTGDQAVDPSEFSGEDPELPDLDGDVDNDTPPSALDSEPEEPEAELEPDLGRERR
jgi:hypothetical protein